MEIIILAGGFGTRLQSVVSDLPKPMAPVKGKPFVEYLLNWINKYPVSKIVFSVGYKHEKISEYFGNSFKGIPIVYAIEDKPLGTGGAIANTFKYLDKENAIVINGDTSFPINLASFFDMHIKGKNKISLALKEMKDFDRYGTVNLNKDTISEFNEKKYCETGLINAGIYAINLEYIKSLGLPEVFSFEKDVFEKNTSNGLLKGYIFDNPFIDIGIPEDYELANKIL